MLKKLNIKLESLCRQSKYSLENPENSEISEICLLIQKRELKRELTRELKMTRKKVIWYGMVMIQL